MTEGMHCPNCGSKDLESDIETEDFSYEDGGDTVELKAVVVVYLCQYCEAIYPDMTAAQARKVAIEDHERLQAAGVHQP